MAKKFLSPLNLLNLTADPGTATEGDIYWNSSTNKLRVYQDGSWINAPAGNADTVTNGIYTSTTSLPNVTSVNGTTIPASSTLIDTSATSQTKTGNFASSGDISAGLVLKSMQSVGGEGGEIQLAKPASSTTLAGDVSIDIYQNKLRFFENGGSARGFYIDITAGGNSAGTNLVSAGGGGSGTVTSVDMTVPTGLSITGNPITTSGTLAVTFASGYSIPTTSSQGNWDTAYGWGNHSSAGYLTGNQSISISGDASGSGTTSISLTLANSGVTANTYNDSATSVTPFTVDSKGRITSTGTAVTITPLWSSIGSKPTTVSGFGITDAIDTSATAQTKSGNLTAAQFIKSGGTSSEFLKADGSVDSSTYLTTSSASSTYLTQSNAASTYAPIASPTFTGTVTLAADPSAALEAATKQYVDAATAGLNVHASVKAATTTNITLATDVENGDVLDGITLATGNRILIKNQTTKSENGVYVVAASGAPTRATDYDSAPEVDAGDFVFVEGGTVNGKTGWVQTNTITTIGSDNIEFTQFTGVGTYTAGDGLDLTVNDFSVDSTVARTNASNTFSANQLISANTSGNALEIRQIGAGNALVVEDDTNPDATPFVINASGQVGIGTASPANPLQINSATNANLQVNGDSNTAIIVQRSSDDTTSSVLAFRKARGTTSSRTTINAGDFLGNIRFEGFDGTNSTLAGTINLAAEGTISTGIIPGRMTFNTVNSSGTNTERMRIDSSGNVNIGHSAGASGIGNTRLLVSGTDFSSSTIQANRFSADASSPFITLGKSRGATVNTYTAVTAGDSLGTIGFYGADGTNLGTLSSSIVAAVDGTVSTGIVPGRLVFNTENSSGTLTERMRIDSSGNSTFTGTIITPAATTSLAPIRIPHGTAPTSPTNGDIWTTTTGLFIRVNGATVGPLGNTGVTTISFGTTGLTPNTGTSGDITVAGTLVAANGGTGQSSYAVGDILYASTTTALSKLAGVATGNALISGGLNTAPSWGKIGLTTHVSGTLAVANGGTGVSSASITAFNNITGFTASGTTGTTSTNLVFSTSPQLTTPNIGAASGTSLTLTGALTAATKSFDIPHPTKENMRLRYGSLEGPENGVYVRGKSKEDIIELPDYWTGLVDADSITVSITPIGKKQDIYVNKIEDNKVYLGGKIKEYFFTIFAERKDVDKLIVEY